ncbi:DUF3376 domain-containing protein [Nocardioides sp.]|uniref:DUF3376 domain-containing protein n=1 Tax=Nocardioides sp. TaxID=35761 RepID=UPI00272035FD|nr:DUF3376 domain-containing protein [Nocardioides sp.]MDO9456513.1 DUF3376 domain-containing protein [Nocardioides sp.]
MTHAPTETRFALVLNGGVSLAIWMSGVVHELNRLRLASLDAAPADEDELPVHEAWRRILEATGRSVVVDAVAGTSAGGLNGTLLATSVARGAELRPLKDTWSDIASLEPGKLLRPDVEDAPSVLDGDYFSEQVHDVLDAIEPRADIEKGECTLLVTATALKPAARRYALEGGLDAHAVDSRRVYQFRRRTTADGSLEGPDDFVRPAEPRRSTIALAARASAGFPAAFSPVRETDDLAAKRRDRVPPAEPDPLTWLIDGGVLDNAPFEPLIESLRDRTVRRPFERVVLYVTPAVGGPHDEVTTGPWVDADVPPHVAAVLGAVATAVREPDQRADMERLTTSFENAAYSRSSPAQLMTDLLLALLTGDSEQLDDADASALGLDRATTVAEALFPLYRARRLEEVERWLTGINRVPRLAPALPLELGEEQPPGVPSERAYDPASWTWGLPAAGRVLRWWGRAMVAVSSSTGADLDPAFAALDHAQRRVRTLRGREEGGLRWIDDTMTPLVRLEQLVGVYDELGVAAEVAAVMEEFTTALAGSLPGTTGPELAQYGLDVEVAGTALVADPGDRPSFRYRQVTPAAAPLLSAGVTGEAQWPALKLYGERWNHFGAFGSKKGREHDWLWGRLDGASALCEYLVGPDFQTDPLCTALAEAIRTADGTDQEAFEKGAAEVFAKQPDQLFQEFVAEPVNGGQAAVDLLLATVPEVLGTVPSAGTVLEAVTSGHPTFGDIGKVARVKAVTLNLVTLPIRAWVRRKIDDASD